MRTTEDGPPGAVRREYDRIARDYDRRWRRYIDATLGAVIEGLSLTGRERLLDLPCGTGELERRLRSRWPELRCVGLDLSGEMLRAARHKSAGTAAAWAQADAGRLPLADGSVDVAVCANGFHYYREPVEALRELRRVLRPGGTLVLVDWCDDYLSCKLCGLWLRATDRAFARTYAARHCRALLEEAGFAVEGWRRFRVGWIWGMMRFTARRP